VVGVVEQPLFLEELLAAVVAAQVVIEQAQVYQLQPERITP